MPKICIIGGGISGLATASFLEHIHPLVFEQQQEVGGWVKTIRHESGASIDLAANGWLNNEPAVGQLLERLDLVDQVIEANEEDNTRWIFHRGTLVPAPLSPLALIKTPLLSLGAKLRIFLEPLMPKRGAVPEESLAEFVARRLGRGVVDNLLAPMVAGIFAAKPEELSLAATFPQLLAMEQQHGSLFRALRRREKRGAPRLQTLRGGAGELTRYMGQRLGERLRVGQPLLGLQRSDSGWSLQFAEDTVEADVVVLACPAHVQTHLLRSAHPALSEALGAIAYSAVAVVVSLYPKTAWDTPPTGFGALATPGTDAGGALGTLFSSCIFPGQHPDDIVVTRTIMGGTRYPEVMEYDEAELIQRVAELHRQYFGPPRSAPLDVRVYKHAQAIPRYDVGHGARQDRIRQLAAECPGLFLVGNHLHGVGVKDCIRNGQRTAEAVQRYLGDGIEG